MILMDEDSKVLLICAVDLLAFQAHSSSSYLYRISNYLHRDHRSSSTLKVMDNLSVFPTTYLGTTDHHQH